MTAPPLTEEKENSSLGGARVVWSRRQLLFKYIEYVKLVAGQGATAPGESGYVARLGRGFHADYE